MMAREYHCLVAGLPDMVFDDQKGILKLAEFKKMLEEELHPDDYLLVELIFLPYDNRNLLSFLKLKKQKVDELGNYHVDRYEDLILYNFTYGFNEKPIREYLITFLKAFREGSPLFENISWENQLISLYYDSVLTCKNDFLRDWFEFDLNIKNVLTAITCRKMKYNPETEIIGDNLISRQLKNNTSKDFGLQADFPLIENILQISSESNLLERERKLDLLRWDYLDEHTFFHYFTIEKILSYLIKLTILHRWMKLNPEMGKEMFNRMVSDIEKSYEFPEEFKL